LKAHAQTDRETTRLKNRDAGVVNHPRPAIEVVKHRPHRITTRGQTAMVMLHLRQITVASFNRRRRPLKRLGMRRRPRVSNPPASRFFRRSFPDLFEHVLSKIDELPMPRQRRQSIAASH
jgi:hypothetical protein